MQNDKESVEMKYDDELMHTAINIILTRDDQLMHKEEKHGLFPQVYTSNGDKPNSRYTKSTYGDQTRASGAWLGSPRKNRTDELKMVAKWIEEEVENIPSGVDKMIKDRARNDRTFLAERVEGRKAFDPKLDDAPIFNTKQKKAEARMLQSFIAKVVKNVNEKIRAARLTPGLSITGDDVADALHQRYPSYDLEVRNVDF